VSPVESTAVREKRLELQELEQAKDFWGPEAYEAMRQALQDDLAELQGEPVMPRRVISTPCLNPNFAAKETPMPSKPAHELTEEQKEARRKYHREWKAKQRAEKGSPKKSKKVDEKPPRAPKVVQPTPEPEPVKARKVEGFPAIDALRSQALALLPMLDGIAFDDVEAARHELEAVGDILGLGFRMLSRKKAAA